MEISWEDTSGHRLSARIDAHIMPFVAALGLRDAAEFLVLFANKDIHLSEAVQEKSQIAQLYGVEKTERLYWHLHANGIGYGEKYKVPVARKFLARYLRSNGLSIVEISRQLSTTDVTIRKLLKSDEKRQSARKADDARRLNRAIDDAVALGLVVRVPQNGKGSPAAASEAPKRRLIKGNW
jgi:hypothetical protein